MIDDSDKTNDILRAHAEKTERNERPAPESLDALREAGDFALRVPRGQGGAGAGVEAVARRLTALGRACPSSAWVAGTCATSKNLAGACFPGADDLFADADALFCGSGVPGAQGVRDGDVVRVSGRWQNVSGCEDAAWASLAVMVDGVFSLAVIPVAELTIDRTWQMAGMRGTGSHTLVAEDLPVPASRVAAAPPFGLNDVMLYAMTVLGPVVGGARGALDTTFAMFASDRKPFMSAHARMGESAGARYWLAEAARLVDRAEETMLSVAREADARTLSDVDAPRLRMALADAGRDARAAVERLMDLNGAGGFRTANVLQRFWRDVSVGSRHPHLNPYLAVETYGTALAGAGDAR
ncbi:acyl-CoA dehydrogenase family protein [Actinacidiphila yeochonensis]|uniref:acyl-CoA dehydrogenase n=1 Tax=Actinacidiphila yeochonensis TaxID=89050 RepID=UPI000559FAF6|nr:acyl-CoA dehydrogenase [Actinacidiphila yeochonensis]